jgi:hypothetical protein
MSLPRRTNDFYFVGSPSIAEDIAAAVEHSRRRSGFSSIATDSVIQEEVGWEIDDFAKRHGITLAPGTQPWRQLGLAFMQAYASDRHRDAVEAMGEIPTLPAITVAPGATEAAAAAPPPVRLGGGTPFSVTAAKYLEEMQCDKSDPAERIDLRTV